MIFFFFFHDLLNENKFYWSNNCVGLSIGTPGHRGTFPRFPIAKKVYFFYRNLKIKAYLILSYQMKKFNQLSIINDLIYSHNPVITLKEYMYEQFAGRRNNYAPSNMDQWQ